MNLTCAEPVGLTDQSIGQHCRSIAKFWLDPGTGLFSSEDSVFVCIFFGLYSQLKSMFENCELIDFRSSWLSFVETLVKPLIHTLTVKILIYLIMLFCRLKMVLLKARIWW